MLNDEQLWDKCCSGQRITFGDLGLDPTTRKYKTEIRSEDRAVYNTANLCYGIGITIISGMVVGLLVMTFI